MSGTSRNPSRGDRSNRPAACRLPPTLPAFVFALLQSFTGPVRIDQPLELQGGINVVPTDGNGVTLARTPQQVHREPVTACVACQLAGCLGPCQPLRTSAGARLGNRPGQLRSSVAHSPAHSLMAPLPALLWPPLQVLNILVGGSQDGKGWFFPEGVNGRINTPVPLALPVRAAAVAPTYYTRRRAEPGLGVRPSHLLTWLPVLPHSLCVLCPVLCPHRSPTS